MNNNTIGERIRKIREIHGLKQNEVAAAMGITQQAYSWLETKSGNIKMNTLQKAASVLKVTTMFLVNVDIPVSEQNIKVFGSTTFNDVVLNYEKMKTKIEVYEELLMK